MFTEMLTYFGVLFVLLASLNAVKRYVKASWLRSFIGYHYFFGAIAAMIYLTRFIVHLVNSQTTVFGLVAFVFVMITVSLGGAFKQKREQQFYLIHKTIAKIMVLAVIVDLMYLLFFS